MDIANANPFRYRGYFYDNETGFYYVSSRYYDANIGRFINADEPLILFFELENLSQYNLLVYCWNNFVNMIDVEGVWPSATWKKSSDFMLIEIRVPWKDIEQHFKVKSYAAGVLGIIACFIPDPTLSKAIGVASGIVSIVSSIISEVIAKKKSGKSIWIGLSFNYKIVVNRQYIFIVNTRWVKIGYWYTWKTAKISNIKWWVKL